jgi:hypothetical protein
MKGLSILISVCVATVSLITVNTAHAQQKLYAHASSTRHIKKSPKIIAPKPVKALKVAKAVQAQAPHISEPTPWTKPQEPSSSTPALAMDATPPTYTPQNPYLVGFIPTSPENVIGLSFLSVVKADRSLSAFLNTIGSYPARIADRLPSIKTVYPTGSKPVKVINLACPAEVVTGEHFAPFDALRAAGNMIFEGINSTNVLPNDIMLVCT